MLRLITLPQINFNLHVIFLILLSCSWQAFSTPTSKPPVLKQNIFFTNLDINRHLPHPAVNAIEQDSAGFIWLATQNGLTRYDGKNSHTYLSQPTDNHSLSNDWIWDILSDSEGRLWVASSGGFHLYTPENDGFINYDLKSGEDVQGESYVAIAEDKQGNIWFASQFSGLTKFDTKQNTLTSLQQNSDQGSLNSNTTTDIVFDASGNMYVATASSGVNVKLATGHDFQYLTTETNHQITSNKIRKLHVDNNQNIWVATEDAGVFVLQGDQVIKSYAVDNSLSSSICSNTINDIYQSNNGDLWFATEIGLCQLDNKTGQFILYNQQDNSKSSLTNNRIISIKQDEGGVIWLGTLSGVSRWNASLSYFSHMQKNDADSILRSNSIMAFTESKQHFLVGTWGGGVSQYLIQGNSLAPDKQDARLTKLSNLNVMSLHLDKYQNIWIGTYRNGLYKLPFNTNEIINFQHNENDINSLSSNSISKIIGTTSGKLAIATYGGGLNMFNYEKNNFSRISLNNENNGKSLFLVDLIEDENQNLWIATTDYGVVTFDLITQTLKPFNQINATTEIFGVLNTKQYIWFATSTGILRINKAELDNDSAEIEHIGRQYGLASNFSYGLLEDERGYIWISHSKGISRLGPVTLTAINFNKTHGLQGDDFNSSAFYKSKSGRMFFGGSNGFNTFMPNKIPVNDYKPPLRLTQFSLANVITPIQKLFKEDGVIELKHNQTIMDFEFAALDYTQPESNNYQFKMQGINDVWHDLGSNNRVSFSYLNDGNYQLLVKGSNNDGVWSDEMIIPIRVLPPIWRSTAAYIIYFIIALLVIIFVIRIRKEKREKQIAHERKLHKLAYFDTLTGLPNRQNFYEKLEKLLSRNASSSASIVYLDLDRFKRINDTLGHAFGDKVLIEIANRLQTAVKDCKSIIKTPFVNHIGIQIARLGGDEFSLCLSGASGSQDVANITQNIIDSLSQPIKIEHYEVTVTPSIGIAVYPEHGTSVSELMKHADIAMYQAKADGRRTFNFYAESLNDKAMEHLHIEEYMRSAVTNNEFELYYQPQVNIKLNKVTKAEALIRWHSPQLGFVSPADFIPIAEESGLILEIGDWILKTACQQAKGWFEAGINDCRISVNVSSVQFKQSALIDKIQQALDESGLPANMLEIELTESAIMSDVEDNIERLQKLKNMGVSIACDDFGTGYSSLSYLKLFPLDTLKIDRSFVDDVAVDENDAAIVKAIMLLADTMQLKVVAEGIETIDQLKVLNQYNCELIQGYYFSRPLPNNDFIEFVKVGFLEDKSMWELELLGH